MKGSDMANHDIIAMGSSAGGVEALMRLVSKLPEDLPASIFVAQHMAPNQPSALAEILSRSGPLVAENASDRQAGAIDLCGMRGAPVADGRR